MERQNGGAAAVRYLYAVACHEDEAELCRMEMQALLGSDPEGGSVVTDRDIDPDRSPFIRAKLTVLAEAERLEQLTVRTGADAPGPLAGRRSAADTLRPVAERTGADAAERLTKRDPGTETREPRSEADSCRPPAERSAALADTQGRTFKVVFVETDGRTAYGEQRAIEREIGARIRGKAEMRTPELRYGIANAGGRWLFGMYERSRAAWLEHNVKPRPYSTALGTRVARAVVNIAAPRTEGVRVIDPCCGIGTVVIEALSMGIDIEGCDMNPLAVTGARVNLAHFRMPDVVKLADMRTIAGEYDAAIVDLPYNLCSVLPPAERLAMLESARRLAPRVVIVTVEPVEEALGQAGLAVTDRCVVRKGRFERHILLCRREKG
jgi:16S rRNA G966 N2-methylase RsmD